METIHGDDGAEDEVAELPSLEELDEAESERSFGTAEPIDAEAGEEADDDEP